MGTFRHVYLFYLFAALKRDISNLLFTQMSCFCTRVHMKTQRTIRPTLVLCKDKTVVLVFLTYLHIPEPQLGAVVRSTGDQVDVVGTPGQVGDTVRMTLQGPQQLQLVALLQH